MKNTEYYKQKLIDSPFLKSSFNQRALIATYDSIAEDSQSDLRLDPGGSCFGFCFDYTRHVESHNNLHKESDYVAKLQLKIITGSRNFVKRINQYQQYLQFSDINYSNWDKDGINYTIENLPPKLDSNHIIGLVFTNRITYAPENGHIISVQPIKDEVAGIIGYKIFDPNFGEFDCSSDKTKITNINNCNEILNNLCILYETVGLACCRVIDLTQKVTDYNFIKQQNTVSHESYSGGQKYLDEEPKLPKKELYNLLQLALTKEDIPIVSAIITNYGHDFLPLTSSFVLNEAINLKQKDIVRLMCVHTSESTNQLENIIESDNKKREEFLTLLEAAKIKNVIIKSIDAKDKKALQHTIAIIPREVQEELAKQIGLELTKQNNTLPVKQIILAFPKSLQEKYFGESRRGSSNKAKTDIKPLDDVVVVRPPKSSSSNKSFRAAVSHAMESRGAISKRSYKDRERDRRIYQPQGKAHR